MAGGFAKEVSDESDIKDIITFLESSWGLNLNETTQPLLPAQKFILKTYYKIPLDNTKKTIVINDKFNERNLYTFTEEEYLKYLYNEGRCNIGFLDDKPRNELVLIIGRRGSKCFSNNSPITTTLGTITAKELLDRLKCNERIGILTYDPNTFEKYITYSIKAEDNGITSVIGITTHLGRYEEATEEHPYFVWRDSWDFPRWVHIKDILEGDRIAISLCQNLFGENNLTDEEILCCLEQTLTFEENGIPESIKKSNKKSLSNFLKHLFLIKNDNSGKLVNDIYTSSEALVKDIKRELLKFGVITSHQMIKNQYRICVMDLESLKKLNKELFSLSDEEFTYKFSKYDQIISNILLIHPCGKKHYVRPIDLERPAVDNKLYNLYNSEIGWDIVKKIESLGVRETVALEVKDTNIIGNDIISHNSTLASWVAAYETYKLLKVYHPQNFYKLLPDSEIHLTCVATSEDQANLLFRQILGYYAQCTYFHRYLSKPTTDKVYIRSRRELEKYGEEGKASIVIKSAACSARGVRGAGNLLAIMDEQAHFVDEKTQSNKSDKAVYDALTPSIAQFGNDGKIINISSPLNKSGLLWDLYNQSLNGAEQLLMIQAPSWEINPTLSTSFLKGRYNQDPISYDCEFGGNFSDRVKAWMPEEYLRRIIVPDLRPKTNGTPRVPHFVGLDIGLKEDGTAIAISHVETVEDPETGQKIDKIELDFVDQRAAGLPPYESYDILDFDMITDWIKDICSRFHIMKGLIDQHNGALAAQHLAKKGMPQFDLIHHTRNFNSNLYQNFMMLCIDRRLRLFNNKPNAEDDDEIIDELLKLQVKQYSKNVISVEAPKVQGHHDDRSDAIMRSVWLASEAIKAGIVGGKSHSLSNNRFQFIRDANQYKMIKARQHNITDNKRSIRNNRRSAWTNKYGK